MPHRTRPLAALLLFTGLNVVLVSTITPVYDFVCFHEKCRGVLTVATNFAVVSFVVIVLIARASSSL